MEFCKRVIRKVESGCLADLDSSQTARFAARGAAATYSESSKCDECMMKTVRMNRILELNSFTVDVVNGMAPTMERGTLGLVKQVSACVSFMKEAFTRRVVGCQAFCGMLRFTNITRYLAQYARPF